MGLRTADQVKAELQRKGISVAQWARAHDLEPLLVHEVLAGRKKGLRGNSHRAAVLLGIKEGEAVDLPRDPEAKRAAIRSALAA